MAATRASSRDVKAWRQTRATDCRMNSTRIRSAGSPTPVPGHVEYQRKVASKPLRNSSGAVLRPPGTLHNCHRVCSLPVILTIPPVEARKGQFYARHVWGKHPLADTRGATVGLVTTDGATLPYSRGSERESVFRYGTATVRERFSRDSRKPAELEHHRAPKRAILKMYRNSNRALPVRFVWLADSRLSN